MARRPGNLLSLANRPNSARSSRSLFSLAHVWYLQKSYKNQRRFTSQMYKWRTAMLAYANDFGQKRVLESWQIVLCHATHC
jgi:hypothetical protein